MLRNSRKLSRAANKESRADRSASLFQIEALGSGPLAPESECNSVTLSQHFTSQFLRVRHPGPDSTDMTRISPRAPTIQTPGAAILLRTFQKRNVSIKGVSRGDCIRRDDHASIYESQTLAAFVEDY